MIIGADEINPNLVLQKAKPKCIMSYPEKRNLSHFRQLLIDDDLAAGIPEFCFPNGVFIKKLNFWIPDKMD